MTSAECVRLDRHLSTPCAEGCGAEAAARVGRVEIALVLRRLGGLDAQEHEGRPVALADHAGAGGDLRFRSDGERTLDPRPGRDLLQIDAEAGVALLVA